MRHWPRRILGLVLLVFLLIVLFNMALADLASFESEPQGPSSVAQRVGIDITDVTTKTVYLPAVFKGHDTTWVSPFGTETSKYDILSKATDAGMKWLRVSLSWKDVEPTNDTFVWTTYDSRLSKVAEASLKPIVYIWKTPSWAVSGQDNYHCRPPDNLDNLEDFFTELVGRYKDAPYNVRYWEIYNEPDGHADGYIGCMGDEPDSYVQVLQTAYQAIKAVDPGATVLIGGLAMLDENGTNVNFLQDVMDLGGGAYFDVLSFHAYSEQYYADYTHEGTLKGLRGKAAKIRNVLANYPGHESKPLMLTEIAERCTPDEEPCNSEDWEEQSNYVVYENARGMATDLDAIIWFTLNYSGFQNSSLLDGSGEAKPAYDACLTLIDELHQARFEREMTASETEDERVEGYVFSLRGGTHEKRVMWTLEETTTVPVSFPVSSLPSGLLRVVDKYGQERITGDNNDDGTDNDGLVTVNVTQSPVYVEAYQ